MPGTRLGMTINLIAALFTLPWRGSRRAKLALWVDANEMNGGVG
jgi:hypothetical protein